MPATYTKRIWNDPTTKVGVYVHVVDSTPQRYSVVYDRGTQAVYLGKDAAIQFAVRFGLGDTRGNEVTVGDSSFLDAARALNEKHEHEGELNPRLLAALYALRLPEKARQRYLRVGALAARAGMVPAGYDAFQEWFAEASESVQARTAKELRTKRAARDRLDTFRRILGQVIEYDVAFRRWRAVVEPALGRFARIRREAEVEKAETNSRVPLTLGQIETILGGCQDFGQAALVVAYLTSGCRAGEPERLLPDHVARGVFRLREVVTKTETQRTPPASIALQSAVEFSTGAALCEDTPRNQFRATCAVGLLQAGVSHLLVMERLGHSSLQMLQRHYAKRLPADWGRARTSEDYLGIGALRIGEWSCPENAWDRWCLRLLLQQAKRFGKLDEAREAVLRASGSVTQAAAAQVDEF